MNWKQKYEQEIAKIPDEYFDERFQIELNKFNPSKEYSQIPENKKEFCKSIKEQFLITIKSDPISAFTTLNKNLPLLAEHLIYCVHKEKLLEEKIFCKCFSRIYLWAGKRNTLFKHVIKYEELLQIFTEYDFKSIMDKEEKQILKQLPKKVNVFRGVAGLSLDEAKAGISWSLKRETAINFAKSNQKYFNTSCNLVLDAIIPRNKILGLFLVRGENEVIIDPTEIIIVNSKEEKIEDNLIQDYNLEEDIQEPEY